MRRLVIYVSIACFCIASGLWGAGRASAADKPALAGRMVTMEVAIAECSDAGAKFETGESANDKLKELEKQGKVSLLTRVRLSTLEQSQVTVQIGERVPVVTGRTMRGGAGPANAVSVTFQNVGTHIAVTPQVDEDGSVLAAIQVENSHLVAPTGKEEGDGIPPRAATLTAKSNVRIPAGQTVVAFGSQSATKEETTQTVILVSATVSAAPRVAVHAPPQLRSFALVHAQAQDAAVLLENLFKDGPVKVVFDARTNTVLAQGDRDVLEQIEAILSKLHQQEKK